MSDTTLSVLKELLEWVQQAVWSLDNEFSISEHDSRANDPAVVKAREWVARIEAESAPHDDGEQGSAP